MGLVDAVKAGGVATVRETIMDWPLHRPPSKDDGNFAVSWTHISKVLSMARARALDSRREVTAERRALEVLRNCLCPVAQVDAVSGDERKRTTVTAPPIPITTQSQAQTQIQSQTQTPTTVFQSLSSPTFFGGDRGISMHAFETCARM
jgi:hypothetical protein